MSYQDDLQVLKKMRESVLFKMYPDIWKKYKFGGHVSLYGRLAYCWIPITKSFEQVTLEDGDIDGLFFSS